MSISAVCPNGHQLNAKEKLAGKRVKCPKCGSVVQVPELELIELDDELVLDESAPHVEPDWLSTEATNEAAPGDALGVDPLGADPLGTDPLGAWGEQSASPSLPTPAQPAAPRSPARQASTKPESGTKFSLPLPLILAMAGGGLVVGLLCLGLVGWLLFLGRSGDDEIAANDPAPVPAGETRPAPAADRGAVPPTDPAPPEPGPTEPAPADVPAAAPSRQPTPWDLVPVSIDQRLRGLKLPGTTWAAAYDEVTGRLAITNDEKKGVLIYDLDNLAKGDPEPEATFATRGLPSAVCLKVLADRRALVIAGQEEPHLLLVDIETLMPFGKVVMQDVQYVDFLVGSPNPDDPFVYYSTADQQDDDDATAGRLGRANLVTGKQDGHTFSQFTDVAVSPDGSRLYARPNSTANGVAGSWNDLLAFNGGSSTRSSTASWARNYMSSPLYPLGDVVAGKYRVFTPSLAVAIAAPDYSPVAAFGKRPVVIGLSDRDIVLGSANDYRRLASIPLPADWLRTDRRGDPADFRARYDLSPVVRSGFFDVKTDDTRDLGLVIFGEHLVIAPLASLNLSAEPSLTVRSTFPAQVTPGTPVQIELTADADDAVFEYVSNTDWLPDETTRLLGHLPPGKPSPKALELHSGVSANQNFVLFKSYEPLKGLKMPFKLRVGNEVMVALRYDKFKLLVQRANPVGHSDSDRIAAIDDAGRFLTKAAPAAKPMGKRLVLAASVNNQQAIIFVNDLRPLAGEQLPARIQIGDEVMTLTGVDDFKTALNVERTEPVSHSVSSDAWLLEQSAGSAADAKPSLPVVTGRTLTWTPAANQLGRQTIRLRATSGSVSREWFWEVTVERAIAELPFQVVGIEPEPGTNRAVIWGQSDLPYLNPTAGSGGEPITYFIGIYDHVEKKLLKHVPVAKPIMAAVLDPTGVYASLIAFDLEPKADRQAENARERAMRQITPTQIVRFDAQTLEVADQVTVPRHCRRLQIIAGKYLAANERWRNETFRFNVPDLSPVEPPVQGYEYATAGRLKDGWVWDGVVWNEAMTEPRLLLFPVHFERPPGVHSPSEMTAAAGGTIYMRSQGPYVGTWCPNNASLPGQYGLTGYPAGLDCTSGLVQAYSWAAPSQQRVGAAPKPTTFKLLDLNTVALSGDRRTPNQRANGYVSEEDGLVHVALLGKLYSVPLSQLVQEEEAFRFVEKQDQFVLDASKPIKLMYSAPGAANYVLQIWYQRPHFADEEPAITAKSADGTFELAAGAIQVSPVKVDAEYVKRIRPPYKLLTGQNPRTAVVPIYVSVIAEHQDGQQKAGLAHSYLIAVPK